MELDYRSIESLLRASTQDELTRVINVLMESYGAMHWIYAIGKDGGGAKSGAWHLLGGYPEAWLKHYFDNGYAGIDPAIEHAKSRVGPMEWPDYRLIQNDPAKMADPRHRLFVEAKDFGLAGGFTVPVHGHGITLGLLSASFGRVEDAVAARKRMGDLYLMCHMIHEAGHGLVAAELVDGQLTPIEVEYLKLAVAGKRTSEIAAYFNRSERTVNAMFSSIVKKMQVRSRQAAVAAAVARRIVVPDV